MDNQYLIQRLNRKKQWFRIRLGFIQLINKPILNFLWLFAVLVTIFAINAKTGLLELLKLPQIPNTILNISLTVLIFLLSIISVFEILKAIGKQTARKDEADLIIAFSAKDLRNGHPILMNKRKIKGTGVTVREFYSNITYDVWIATKEAIADSMNVHFVEEIQYGGKGNNNGKIIVIKTAKGRKPTDRGILYDEEF